MVILSAVVNLKKIFNKLPLWIKIFFCLVIIGSFFAFLKRTGEINQMTVPLKQGTFKVVISTIGELSASSNTKISLPVLAMQNIGFFELSVTRIIPEGTVVDSGDFIIEFDKSSLLTRLSDMDGEIKRTKAAYENGKLDTSLILSEEREKRLDLKNAVEEAQFTLDQSEYESPTAIRQAKNALDKANRELERDMKKYRQSQIQSNMSMDQKFTEIQNEIKKRNDLQAALEKLTIHSTAKGMVVFERDFDGSRKKVGSKINIFTNQAIANIPDLKNLTSRAYVNEMSVDKIQSGQKVNVVVDAFMDKNYVGTVTSVANIGQPLPGHDANLFEVVISVVNTDMKLKPSMRTNNFILISSVPNAMYLPIDAVQSNDTISYVYLAKGNHVIKQQVKTGTFNDNDIVIERGLKMGDNVLFSFPDNDSKIPFSIIK
jgi:multidrug efflux pump subunit AcrA (membrane-fusion protein)